MSDEEYRRALRERDNRAIKYAIRTLSDEAIKAEVERIDWESDLKRLLIKEAATCFCEQLLPCKTHENHEEEYACALRAYDLYKNNQQAIALMKLTICTKKGICQFPPCNEKVGSDWDGGYFVWCLPHNELFSGKIDLLWPKQKARGGT